MQNTDTRRAADDSTTTPTDNIEPTIPEQKPELDNEESATSDTVDSSGAADDSKLSQADSPSLFTEDAPDQLIDPISWVAPEFVHHQKTASWYGLLVLVTAVIDGIVYLLTKDLISTTVIIVGALMLSVYAARQPSQVSYQLDATGATIGTKHFGYEDFRSFSVVPEGALSSIVFTPMKRFGAITTMYYTPQDETKIVELLTSILPFTEYNHDAVDRLMRRIHF